MHDNAPIILAAESSMDDGHNHRLPAVLPSNGHQRRDGSVEQCDSEVWNEFSKSFSEVQSFLDRNRVLIQQVNENHQSKTPDNLVKNVSLIQEINGNIWKVVSLYSDLSTNISSLFHQRQGVNSKIDDDGEKGKPMED